VAPNPTTAGPQRHHHDNDAAAPEPSNGGPQQGEYSGSDPSLTHTYTKSHLFLDGIDLRLN
jgi:hypothetical protein